MFFKYNFWALVWAAFIFFICLLPGNEFPDLSFWELLTFDKIAHGVVFAILVLLLTVGFTKQYTFHSLRYNAVIMAVVVSVFYGGLLEIIQHHFISERKGDVMDFIANSIGSAGGVVIYYFIYGNKSYLH